jgi:hypothetical protein
MCREYGEDSARNKGSLQSLRITNTRPPDTKSGAGVALWPDLRHGGINRWAKRVLGEARISGALPESVTQ